MQSYRTANRGTINSATNVPHNLTKKRAIYRNIFKFILITLRILVVNDV